MKGCVVVKKEELLVQQITDSVNGRFDSKTFCDAMSTEHRTLQQSFMREIVVPWIRRAASDDYRTDMRNEATHNLAKQLKKVLDESDGLPMI